MRARSHSGILKFEKIGLEITNTNFLGEPHPQPMVGVLHGLWKQHDQVLTLCVISDTEKSANWLQRPQLAVCVRTKRHA